MGALTQPPKLCKADPPPAACSQEGPAWLGPQDTCAVCACQPQEQSQLKLKPKPMPAEAPNHLSAHVQLLYIKHAADAGSQDIGMCLHHHHLTVMLATNCCAISREKHASTNCSQASASAMKAQSKVRKICQCDVQDMTLMKAKVLLQQTTPWVIATLDVWTHPNDGHTSHLCCP